MFPKEIYTTKEPAPCEYQENRSERRKKPERKQEPESIIYEVFKGVEGGFSPFRIINI